jgi:putative spermidine/putrescine transport system permease protein
VTPRRNGLRIALLLLPAAGFVALSLSLVLLMTLAQSVGFFSFTGDRQFGLEDWQVVIDPQTWDSIWYSVRIALVSSIGGLFIAFPLALLLRRSFVGHGVLTATVRIPLFVPALVAAFLILNVLSFHGILNSVLLGVGVISEPLRLTHDDAGLGVIFIQVWKNVPFQALIIGAVLVNIPGDLEPAARNLGGGGLAVFRHVLLPHSMPGVLTAVILVFIGVLGDYAINSIAGPIYPPSLSIRMYLLGRNFGEWGQAAVIALLIMVLSIVFAWLFMMSSRVVMRFTR